MRYNDEIIFVKNNDGSYYDSELGEWIEEVPVTTITTANVTDLGTNRSVTLFGHIKQGAKVIRLTPLFSVPEWDYIEINSKTYELATEREPLERNTLIVQEVVLNVEKNG